MNYYSFDLIVRKFLKRKNVSLSVSTHSISSTTTLLLLLAFTWSPISLAQLTEIVPVDESDLMCVDTSPYRDGLGWNGECTCTTTNRFLNFGAGTASFGNTLILSAWDTPNGCSGHGFASVYRIGSENSTPEHIEYLPSYPATTFTRLESNQIDINENLIAVGEGFTFVNIYNRHDLTLQATLNKPTAGQTGFGGFVNFTSDQLVVSDSGSLQIYNTADWSLAQTISGIGSNIVLTDKYIANYANGKAVVYERNDNGSYERVLSTEILPTHNSPFSFQDSYDFQDDTLAVLRANPVTKYTGPYYSESTTITHTILHTYKRNGFGNWAAAKTIDLPATSTIKLINGKPVHYNETGIYFLGASVTEGWIVDQHFPFDTDIKESRLYHNGEEIIVVSYYSTEENNNKVKVDILNKDSVGIWVVDRTYEDLPLSGNVVFGRDKLYLTAQDSVLQLDAQLDFTPEQCTSPTLFCEPVPSAAANPTPEDTLVVGSVSNENQSPSKNGGAIDLTVFLLLCLSLIRSMRWLVTGTKKLSSNID